MTRIYMDYNATAPMAEEVKEVVLQVMNTAYGNASSVHAEGREARQVVEMARGQVANLIGSTPAEVVLMGSATEANNLAIRGHGSGGPLCVVTTAVEHPSVLGAGVALEGRGGKVLHVGVDPCGRLDVDQLRETLTEEVTLVSVMHANNETGVITDIKAVGEVVANYPALFHVDAVQTAGRLPLDVKAMGVDMLTLSGHKMQGPKGAAALYLRRGLKLAPLLSGGHQERGLRGGTEVVWALAGLGQAADLARTRASAEALRLSSLRERLWDGIHSVVPGVRRQGLRENTLSNTLNVAFSGCPGDALLMQLDMEGVSASSGSACASGTVEPSHVLLAMGNSPDEAREAVRFSMGYGTTAEEVERLVSILPGLVERTRTLVVEGEWDDWEAKL